MASAEDDGRCEDSSELEDLEESFEYLEISGESSFNFKFEFVIECGQTKFNMENCNGFIVLQFSEGNELQGDDAYNDVGDHFFGRKQVFPCTVDLNMQFSALKLPNEVV